MGSVWGGNGDVVGVMWGESCDKGGCCGDCTGIQWGFYCNIMRCDMGMKWWFVKGNRDD